MDRHDEMTHVQRTDKVRRLNDRLRTTGLGGRTVMTRAVSALPPSALATLLLQVKQFNDFTPGNDPHGEHDFGKVTVDAEALFWKIDYYDVNLEFGSPDPSDDTVTCRVLTIMTAVDL